MSMAEKLTAIAENQQRVYDAGYAKGKAEGGESGGGDDGYYDTFWDVFQNYGERVNYAYAFGYNRFSDENYNPKYPILTKSGSTPSRYMFAQSASITDTKVPIYANGSDVNYAFQGCTGLVTIRELHVNESQTFTSTFAGCNALKNITFVGVIGKSIGFPNSPLTPESMKNVISCLKDYSGTSDADTQTLTFTSTCWTALEADSAAPDGGTWKQYVKNKGWKV